MGQVWARSPVYFYNRTGAYCVSRAVPSDLRHRFPKKEDRGFSTREDSLRTKSESKAAGSVGAAIFGIGRKHLYAVSDRRNFPGRIHVSDSVVDRRVIDLEA